MSHSHSFCLLLSLLFCSISSTLPLSIRPHLQANPPLSLPLLLLHHPLPLCSRPPLQAMPRSLPVCLRLCPLVITPPPLALPLATKRKHRRACPHLLCSLAPPLTHTSLPKHPLLLLLAHPALALQAAKRVHLQVHPHVHPWLHLYLYSVQVLRVHLHLL